MDKIKEEEIRSYLKRVGNIIINFVLNKSSNKLGTINVEMYIDSNDEYSGYYIYTLKYDNNYIKNGVKRRSLKFKRSIIQKSQKKF